MPSEALRSSVAYGRSEVNTRPVTEITPARERAQMRSGVIYDRALSPGARMLYVALDDYAGIKGTAWPKQATLADRLGFSLRSIQVWLDELVAAHYLTRRRGPTGNIYGMAWSAAGSTNEINTLQHDAGIPGASQAAGSDMQPAAREEPAAECMSHMQPAACVSIQQLEFQPLGPCPRCNSSGWFEWESWNREGRYTRRIRCGCITSDPTHTAAPA